MGIVRGGGDVPPPFRYFFLLVFRKNPSVMGGEGYPLSIFFVVVEIGLKTPLVAKNF